MLFWCTPFKCNIQLLIVHSCLCIADCMIDSRELAVLVSKSNLVSKMVHVCLLTWLDSTGLQLTALLTPLHMACPKVRHVQKWDAANDAADSLSSCRALCMPYSHSSLMCCACNSSNTGGSSSQGALHVLQLGHCMCRKVAVNDGWSVLTESR